MIPILASVVGAFVRTVGQGIQTALSNPSISQQVSSTLSDTIKAVGSTVMRGMGDAMVDTAKLYGKYNIDANLSTSMAVRTSMAELQQATFDNAQAMLANAGGVKAFNEQLRTMSSSELIRKAGYDTAKALQITADTLTTVRAVVGKQLTDVAAGDEAKDMVKFFQQSAAAGHTTVEEYSNLAKQLSTQVDVTDALNRLNSTSRTATLKSIIATRDHAMELGFAKDKALEFATALIAARQDTVSTRFKTGAATVSMVALARSQGFQGMSQAESIEMARLQALGSGRTAEQNKRFEELVPKVGEALAFLRQSQEGSGQAGLPIQAYVEKFEEAMSSSKYGKSVLIAAEAPGRAGLATQSETPGSPDSTVGPILRALGGVGKTIQVAIDGLGVKGLTAALFGATAATIGSIASMTLLTIATNASTVAMGGRGLMGALGSVAGGLGRVAGGLAGIAGKVIGTVAGGAVLGAGVGYGISSMLDKEEATKSETVGGGIGGALGGAAGGVVGGAVIGRVLGGVVGTMIGGPIGTAIGMGVGGVAGHYLGTAIGSVFNDEEATTASEPKKSPATSPQAAALPVGMPVTPIVRPEDWVLEGSGVKADSYYMGSASPSQQVTQPIVRQSEMDKLKFGTVTEKGSPEYQATLENTDVLRSVLKAQQMQNNLMTDYIDIYKQTNEPTLPFSAVQRPEKEPHNAR